MKNIILKLYMFLNTLNIIINSLQKKPLKNKPILFLNGAIPGSGAGPKVKVARLKSLFKTSRLKPNIFYCLSNCIYSSNHIVKKYVKFKIPIIYNQNGIYHKYWYHGNVSARNNKMKFYLQNSDYVFYQSKFCKKCCDENIFKRTQNYKILYNAVDTNIFRPGKGLNTSHISVLKIGTYTQRNLWRLVDTIETIQNINQIGSLKYKLSIVGFIDNETKKIVNNLIQSYELDEDIFLLGKKSQDEIVGIMQRHMIFLTTKLHDPCSNAVIEAMACGLPIIFHNSGGNFELVNDAGWGFGKKQKSISKIIAEKNDLLTKFKKINREEILIKSRIARDRAVKYFNINKWQEEHSKVFNYFLEKKNNNNDKSRF